MARSGRINAVSVTSGGGHRRDSTGVLVKAGPSRRKLPHTAMMSSSSTVAKGVGGRGPTAGAAGSGRGVGDRRHVPLDRLKRVAVIGPNTLIVELEVEVKGSNGGGEWEPATLVIGPCDAPRFGSLLAERVATVAPRRALGQVVRKARKLAALGPPPLPPRPSGRGLGGAGGGGDDGRTGVLAVRGIWFKGLGVDVVMNEFCGILGGGLGFCVMGVGQKEGTSVFRFLLFRVMRRWEYRVDKVPSLIMG